MIYIQVSHFAFYDEVARTNYGINTLKSFSPIDADKEDHISDVLSNAIFRLTIDSGLHLRGESQVDAVLKLIRNFQKKQQKIYTRAVVPTSQGKTGRIYS